MFPLLEWLKKIMVLSLQMALWNPRVISASCLIHHAVVAHIWSPPPEEFLDGLLGDKTHL